MVKGRRRMNNEEIQALMAKLQEAGLSPEDIADGILWPLFRDGKMSKEDLGTLCNAIGLELDEDFEKDEGPAPEDGDAEISKEEAEDLKEIEPGESKEEFKEKIEEAKDPEAPAPEDKPEDDKSEEKSDDDEDEEWDEVKKNIFKL